MDFTVIPTKQTYYTSDGVAMELQHYPNGYVPGPYEDSEPEGANFIWASSGYDDVWSWHRTQAEALRYASNHY